MIQNIIQIIFKFFLFFVIVICVGYVTFRFILHHKMNGLKQRVFGLFMELDNVSVFAISVVSVRLIFLFYMYMNRGDISLIHLYTLLYLSVLFGIFSKSIKNLLLDLSSNTALYFSLLSSKVLSSYTVEVQFVWYVFLGNYLLLFFIALSIIYFYVRHINDVVSRTKYIRRYRSEEI